MTQAPTLKRLARDTYVRTSLRLFGNHVGFGVNALYFAHALLYRLRNGAARGLDAPGSSNLEELRTKGYTKIDPVLSPEQILALQTKLDFCFSDPDKVVHSLEDGGLVRLRRCLMELPELEAFIAHPRVDGVLRAYFGGPYTGFSADVYRTFPADAKRAEEVFPSLLWHFDNCPAAMLKIMIYLRDTTVDTGALTLVDKQLSTRLRREGFWERNSAAEFDAELARNAIRLEGKAGSVLLFSTHHCIHKATLPRKDLRDVAVFLLQPTLKPATRWSDADRQRYSRNFGYCVNPFTSRPLRSGDE